MKTSQHRIFVILRSAVATLAAAVVVAVATPLHSGPQAAAYVNPATGSPYASGVIRAPDIPERNWMPGHRGVDLAAAPGATVRAAGEGEVAFVGTVVGVPTVSIVHPDGIRTTYQPVHASVKKGDRVDEGSPIGTLGHPFGRNIGLQWGALIAKDTYINPLSLLAEPRIRLKPVD
ncbi:M23 family metallopeptidase [Corynebacterium aquatimens]|uniref:Murein DD-endopeptidase MepM/ murein hydrolase activator NlpD n=1 Tax=Corynebacterium aquatimens TaxID=1190508 RepID=A0A931GVY6_9CORY|nr:M23 family metallopeptidase [Corynebacterium aquatimens]MBG6121876.1 murein DD-endopeptidase MepM/ murein hydrolase activator NlpD [Corynebacterium aquatimens]WJY65586.1 Peptidase family M23 [Corynebacterium aquatimens]